MSNNYNKFRDRVDVIDGVFLLGVVLALLALGTFLSVCRERDMNRYDQPRTSLWSGSR